MNTMITSGIVRGKKFWVYKTYLAFEGILQVIHSDGSETIRAFKYPFWTQPTYPFNAVVETSDKIYEEALKVVEAL